MPWDIISIPCIRMPSVPVIASVCVAGPVTAKAHKNEFAVIIRPEVAKGIARSPGVTNRTTTIRPGYPGEYLTGGICLTGGMIVAIAVVKVSESVLIVAIVTPLFETTNPTGIEVVKEVFVPPAQVYITYKGRIGLKNPRVGGLIPGLALHKIKSSSVRFSVIRSNHSSSAYGLCEKKLIQHKYCW